MDAFELGAWTLIVSLLVGPPLVRVPAVRRLARAWGVRLVERLTPVPVVDEEALALYLALRRERLVGDVERLRDLLGRDETMSAVRQIGNRMAYDRLLLDLRALPDPGPLGWAGGGRAGDGPARRPRPVRSGGWLDDAEPGWALVRRQQPVERPGQHRPTVEVLELGRRR